MNTILEPARQTPVAHECDLCVIGGSCTGVFAAVRAARLGLSVALVESQSLFGGMAVTAQVNEWHTLHDAHQRQKIIGGLTDECLDTLRKRNAVLDLERQDRGPYFLFNSTELALDLDALILQHANIRPFLGAACVAAVRRDNRLEAAIIEDKSGRRAIRARFFIDASGDGALLRTAGFEAWKSPHLQPVSYQMMVAGLDHIQETTGRHIWKEVRDLCEQNGYPKENASPWINRFAGTGDLRNIYGPRLNGVDASNADQLTRALMDSRRYHRILHDRIRERFGADISPLSPAQAMGVRETWHAHCQHHLSAEELLSGKHFEDAIACGTYPVDIHSEEGTVLRYLDGREQLIGKDGHRQEQRWRAAETYAPAYYEIPYRCLVPRSAENLLVAGRLLDADRSAFGAVRVMVNTNQTGEAAGVAAWLALQHNVKASVVDTECLRKKIREGGSCLPD